METDNKLKYLIAAYFAVLIFLLLSVIAMPLVIRHGFPITHKFIIEEETLETALIVLLFAASFVIAIGFKRALKAYERAAARAGKDKSKLVARLAEAFNYIGTVNVEFKEIQSILCGIEYYPQTKKEFKRLIDYLATQIMAVTGIPWVVIRIIDRGSGRTIKEYAAESHKGALPSATMGNRAVLEGRHVEKLRSICSSQKNLDLLTVCIISATALSEEQILLITAVTNQIEMFFLLYRSGCLHQPQRSIKEMAESSENVMRIEEALHQSAMRGDTPR